MGELFFNIALVMTSIILCMVVGIIPATFFFECDNGWLIFCVWLVSSIILCLFFNSWLINEHVYY